MNRPEVAFNYCPQVYPQYASFDIIQKTKIDRQSAIEKHQWEYYLGKKLNVSILDTTSGNQHIFRQLEAVDAVYLAATPRDAWGDSRRQTYMSLPACRVLYLAGVLRLPVFSQYTPERFMTAHYGEGAVSGFTEEDLRSLVGSDRFHVIGNEVELIAESDKVHITGGVEV